jgi:hypothetical protein
VKHPADQKTADLPGIPQSPKKRGPKPTGRAKSAAERMRDMRSRRLLAVQLSAHTFAKMKDAELLGFIAAALDSSGPPDEYTRLAYLEVGRRLGSKLA